MKRIVAIALFLTASLLATRNANAQNHAVKVDVPFNFTVNETSLPAGEYVIASELTDRVTLVIIRDHANTIKAMDLALDDLNGTGKTSALVFNHYGDQYFLSKIRFASASKAIFFTPAKPEQRAKKYNKKHESSTLIVGF
jgi:hypothetical protein